MSHLGAGLLDEEQVSCQHPLCNPGPPVALVHADGMDAQQAALRVVIGHTLMGEAGGGGQGGTGVSHKEVLALHRLHGHQKEVPSCTNVRS